MINNLNAPQELTLEINGSPFTGFVSPISVSTSIENLCGTFTFTATQYKDLSNFPIKMGDKCKVLIGNVPLVTGFVEDITIQYDINSHNITIEGRDKTCDIVDSTLDGKQTFHAGVTLIDITKKVLSYLGITDIQIYSEVSLDPFSSGEIISSEVGQSAFEFIEYYAHKRQVLVTTDGKGNIVFTRGGSGKTLQTVISNSEIINSKPIVKNANMNISTTKRFNKYIVYSQTNSAGMGGAIENYKQLPVDQEVTMISIPYYDVLVRPTRIKVFNSDTSHINQNDLNTRALWEVNVCKANGFKYSVTMQGFIAEQDNLIWRPNQTVLVVDDICDIVSQLLISSVKYDYTLDGGTETTLELVDKDSFTISIIDEQTQMKKDKTKKEGKGYIIENF